MDPRNFLAEPNLETLSVCQSRVPRIWCPELKPPIIPKYCDLSPDAQLVMAAIIQDYERKKEILRNRVRVKPPEPDNYYEQVYRGSFGSDIPQSALGYTQSVQVTRKQAPCSLLNTQNETSVCPSFFTQASSQQTILPPADFQHEDLISDTPKNKEMPNETDNVDCRYQLLKQRSPHEGGDNYSNLQDVQHKWGNGNSFNNLQLDLDNQEIFETTNSSNIAHSMQTLETNEQNCKLSQESTNFSFSSAECLTFADSSEISISKNTEKLPGLPSLDVDGDLQSGQGSITANLNVQNIENLLLTGVVNAELSPFKCDHAICDKIPEEISVGILPMKRKTDQMEGIQPNCLDGKRPIKKTAKIDKAQPFAKISLHQLPTSILSRHNSVDDADLDIIENILSQDITNSQKSSGKKFRTPFKPPSSSSSTTLLKLPIKERTTTKPTNSSTPACSTSVHTTPTNFLSNTNFCFDDKVKLQKFNVLNIKYVPSEEMISLGDEVLQSKEVLLTLIHKDGSSLLSPIQDSNKKRVQFEDQNKIVGLAIWIQSDTDREVPCEIIPAVKDDHYRCVYIPLIGLKRHSDSFNWACQFLEKLMASPVRKVCFQTKDVLHRIVDTFAFCHTVTFSWIILDVQVAAWLLDPDNPVQTFDELIQRKTNKPENLGKPRCPGQESPIKQLMTDFGLLASTMRQLFHKLTSRELWPLFINLETRLIPLLTKMERTSLKVDPDLFLKFSDILKCKLSRLEKKAHQLAGHTFCINSHPQLRQVLFEELRLDQISQSKTKMTTTAVNHAKSTSEAVLTQLLETHALPAVILEYRQLQKLKSTYVEGLMVCVEKGYLQTHWDQITAATGRLTSYQPNLQSVPKQQVTITDYKTSYIVGKHTRDETFEIFARDPVVSDEGCSLLSADFQQIELRLLAHLSDDPKLTSIFTTTTEDIFIELTSNWLGKAGCSVTEQEREQTKRIVYSVMYGAGKEKLAEYLKIDVSHAKAIMTSFLENFPAINMFTKKCKDYCLNHGYTSTIFKRRRLIPNINSKSPKLRAQAERQAVNFCLQGSAADICKAAMLQVEKALNSKPHLKARLLLQIHDELLFEIPDENMDEFSELVRSVMESTDSLCGEMVHLNVPLSVSISVGKRWGHLEKIRQH